LTTHISYTGNIKSSANITDGWKELESRYDNMPWFPVIWSETPESITQVHREDNIRRAIELHVQATAIVGEEDDI